MTTPTKTQKEDTLGKPIPEPEVDVCAEIEDPVRRGLCRVCGLPVVGEAPFCKDHEPPVP